MGKNFDKFLKNVLGHSIWTYNYSFGQEFKKLEMHFIKGPLQSAAKWPLSVKMFNVIQQCLSNWVTYPLGLNLKIFARTFMSADFVQSTKSTGKEGKAWRSNWVHWEGPRPKNSDHHRNLHNIYFLPTSNIVEISNCKKQGNLDFAIIPSNMVRSWFCKNIYFDKYCFLHII